TLGGIDAPASSLEGLWAHGRRRWDECARGGHSVRILTRVRVSAGIAGHKRQVNAKIMSAKKQGLLVQAPFPGDGHRQCDGRFSRPVVLFLRSRNSVSRTR